MSVAMRVLELGGYVPSPLRAYSLMEMNINQNNRVIITVTRVD